MARTLLGVFSGCLALLVAGGGIVFLGWLLWWLWSRQRQEEETPAEIELEAGAVGKAPTMPGLEEEVLRPEPEEPAAYRPELAEPEPLAQPEQGGMGEPLAARGAVVVDMQPPEPIPVADIEGPGGPDDLLIIEGIGPRCASVLRAAGIRTFRELADTEVARLEEILRTADPRLLRLCKPNTWPEQAALAAAGDWEAFQALTNALKSGRRV